MLGREIKKTSRRLNFNYLHSKTPELWPLTVVGLIVYDLPRVYHQDQIGQRVDHSLPGQARNRPLRTSPCFTVQFSLKEDDPCTRSTRWPPYHWVPVSMPSRKLPWPFSIGGRPKGNPPICSTEEPWDTPFEPPFEGPGYSDPIPPHSDTGPPTRRNRIPKRDPDP